MAQEACSSRSKAAIKTDFNQVALTWDNDPRRYGQNESIANHIIESVPLRKTWRVLDYGCGTGHLAFNLLPHVKEVMALDASEGMIQQVWKKLAQVPFKSNAPLLTASVFDLMKQSPVELGKFDLIVTSTVIHHVSDSKKLFQAFSQLLGESGWLVIGEWFKREGVYKDPVRLSEKGYDPDELTAQIAEHIPNIHFDWKVVHFFKRDDGFDYPIFAAIGKRKRQRR